MSDIEIQMKDKTQKINSKINTKPENYNLPFVEKYHPKSLEDIISQEDIIPILKKFLEKNSIPHLLFYGTAGTGKTTCAQAITNFLYGEHKTGNVLELNASDQRGIDIVKNQIKNFCQTINSFSNFNLKDVNKNLKFVKLVILDEADMMTVDAQSALRRIMEKYTNNVIFILVCNLIYNIHPAIQSRCMKFRFRPMKNDKCLKRLKEICSYENIKYENDMTIKTIIQLGNRDMRKMLNLLEATFMSSERNNYITTNDVYITAGLPSLKEFNALLQLINNKNDNLGNIYSKVNKEKLNKGYSTQDLINMLHDKIRNDNIININDEDKRNCYIKLAHMDYILRKGGDEQIVLQNFICLVREYNL